MPNLPHLILPRAEFDLPRKKTGFGRAPNREHATHGQLLSRELSDVIGRFRGQRRPTGIDPSLILRVKLSPQAGVNEDAWERCGLSILSTDVEKTLILFSSDQSLSEFRSRLNQYLAGPPPGQKGAPHQQIFANVDHIGDVRPNDRIGRLLRAQGVTEAASIVDGNEYVVDVELWELGSRAANRSKAAELRGFVEEHGGRVTDDYVGESLVLLRVRCSGSVLRDLLAVDYVASVDLPPRPTLPVCEILNLGLDDFPEVPSPSDEAPGIAVLDSGLTAAHPFIGPAVGESTTVPRALGDASDGHGHGTMVAGIALYGDILDCIRARSFVPRLTLYSARVLNDDLRFDDESLITTQMRESIEYFRLTYGCRVFNASLGDPRLPYQRGKVSPWASILDTLSRELDVVIVVSAGNYNHDPGDGDLADEHVQGYPRYLLQDPARIIEPATGSIVVTVGALAHAAAGPPGAIENLVSFRPIAQAEQPSPFTRCGPGLGGAIKPEFCEFGGNRAYDGLMRRVRTIRELGIISMNREYVHRLFTTDVGTSYAAPRVAHVAARLYETFPTASANLIRALLASSAKVPTGAADLLDPLGSDATSRLCGYGRPDLEAAQSSDNSRVLLYAESILALDNFHIFDVPIPDELINENGTRSITVSLAYDPPVRHTRFDYLGVKMSFRLIRGKTADQVAEIYRQRSRDEDPTEILPNRYKCSLEPGPISREGGTLQRATFTMRRRPSADYGETYHLVVRCERKWARDDHGPQRYAVVVSVEHSSDVNLYNSIQARVQERTRTRTRLRA